MEMILDKKQIQAVFFFNPSSKWVIKQQRQLAISAMHLAQELLMNSAVVVKEVSQRRQKSPEDEQHGNQSLEVDNDQLRGIIEADSLKTTQEVAEELNVDHPITVWHLKQIGKVKKLNKWMPHEGTKNPKIHHFEVSSSFRLCSNSESFLDRIMHAMKK